MYCSNCQKSASSDAKVCTGCGLPLRLERNFCNNCGEKITNPNQVICTKCNADIRRSNRSNIVAAILALLLGQWGAHKFYNGSRFLGIVYIATTIIGYAALILFTALRQYEKITDQTYSLLLLAGMLPIAVVAITSFIEAIAYLTSKNKYSEKYNFTSTQEEDKKWVAWFNEIGKVIVVIIGCVIGGVIGWVIGGVIGGTIDWVTGVRIGWVIGVTQVIGGVIGVVIGVVIGGGISR